MRHRTVLPVLILGLLVGGVAHAVVPPACATDPAQSSAACLFSGYTNIPINSAVSILSGDRLLVCNTGGSGASFGVSWEIPTAAARSAGLKRTGHTEWDELGEVRIGSPDSPSDTTNGEIAFRSFATVNTVARGTQSVQIPALIIDPEDTVVDCDGTVSTSAGTCAAITAG